MENQDAKPIAESSPAPIATQEVIDTMKPEERHEWRLTGKLPEPKAASTPAKEQSEAEPAKSAAASEAAPKEHPPKRDNAETRLKELLDDLRTAGLSPAELKTFKKEAAKTTPAESSPAKQPEVKAAPTPEAPKEPDINDPQYAGDGGWQKYEADVRKYNREIAEYSANQAVEKFKREQQQAQEIARVQQQVKVGREKYEDFDQKADPVISALVQMPDSPVFNAVGMSPVFEHLVYTLGGDPSFIELAKTNPIGAVMKVGVVQALIMEELASGKSKGEAPRNENGQFTKTEAPSKKVTSAPNPPSEVGGKGTAPADEIADALKKGDFARYKALVNRREMEARKGN